MTDPREPDDAASLSDDDHDDDTVEELADLVVEGGSDFAPRVVRAIERRRLANHGVEFSWFAPVAVLREFVAMTWYLVTGGQGPKETRR